MATKRPRHSQSVMSGVNEEERFFQWRIHNILDIIENDELIKEQSFQFTVEGTSELTSKWKVYLIATESESEGKCIGLGYELESCRHNTSRRSHDVWSKLIAKVLGTNDELLFERDSGLASITERTSRSWKNVVSHKKLTEHKTAGDNTLKLNLTFVIKSLATSQVSPLITEAEFNEEVIKELGTNTAMLLSNQLDDLELSDIKLVSKDGLEFKCHKAILAVRSPVFATMFRTKMSETTTGVMQIDDLSGKTIKILLEYLYSGKLNPDWSQNDVIVEFTYAVGKYQLESLLKYLDGMLGKYCSKEVAPELLRMAEKLNLWKAEKDLMEFIKSYTVSTKTSNELLSIIDKQ